MLREYLSQEFPLWGTIKGYCIVLYCQSCTSAKARLGADTPEFDSWFEGHFGECNVNYTGNPGGMEVVVAEVGGQTWLPLHHRPLRR